MVADSIDPRRAQPRTRYSARADRRVGKRARVARRPARPAASIGLLPPGPCLSGGRSWWAHFESTRINIEPTILRKKIEEFREAGATLLNAAAFIAGIPPRRRCSGAEY
jgi:hypothetical protein